jgi:hypothetical protein
MYEKGYPRETFRILRENQDRNDFIREVRANETVAQLHQYNETPGALYTLREFDSLVRSYVCKDTQLYKNITMSAESMLDADGYGYAFAWLGGGANASVSNLSLHNCPYTLAEISAKLYDNDTPAFPDITGGDYKDFGNFIFASLHEFGHAMTLHHPDGNRVIDLSSGAPVLKPDGTYETIVDHSSVMGLGFYTGYRFLNVEEPDGTQFSRQEEPSWNMAYITGEDIIQDAPEILHNSPWINTDGSTYHYEADNPENDIVGNSGLYYSSDATEGKFIGNIGPGHSHYLQFNNVIGGVGDNVYKLDITYKTWWHRDMYISINGGPGMLVYIPNSDEAFVQKTLFVKLPQEINNIRLYSNDFVPDIDFIELTKSTGLSVYEAEDTANVLTGNASVIGDSYCSGSNKVGNIGPGSSSSIEFTNVLGALNGKTAYLIVHYKSTESRTAYLVVNGKQVKTLSFSATGNEPARVITEIALHSFNNTILFYSDNMAPDIDKIDIRFIESDMFYEAESLDNSWSGNATVYGDPDCSGGYYVGNIGPGAGNNLVFNNIWGAADDSNYQLKINYKSWNDRDAYVSINGGAVTSHFFASTGSTPESVIVNISLPQALNTIEFTSDDFVPEIDSIEILNDTDMYVYEAENENNTIVGPGAIRLDHNCSNSFHSYNIGRGTSEWLLFNEIGGGDGDNFYTITVNYLSWDSRTAYIEVNDSDTISLSFPATGAATESSSGTITLPNASNTIKIYSDWFIPEVDNIIITKQSPTTNA